MVSLRVLAVSGALLVGTLAAVAQTAPVPAENLIRNGSFEDLREGWAAPWQKTPGATIAAADGKHWLHLSGAGATSAQRVDLKPEWWVLRLTLRLRATDVVLGDESWKNARLAMSFHAADGTRVGNWPNVFNAVGSTDWLACDREYSVPRGAVYLSLNPANFGTAGSIEFDDLQLVVTKERALTKTDAPLPDGVGDPWAAAEAWQVETGTQGRLCLNGLWAFRPVLEPAAAQAIPAVGDCWGWFKVPGIWPAASWSAGESAQVVLLFAVAGRGLRLQSGRPGLAETQLQRAGSVGGPASVARIHHAADARGGVCRRSAPGRGLVPRGPPGGDRCPASGDHPGGGHSGDGASPGG